jgi:hypothetical protein
MEVVWTEILVRMELCRVDTWKVVLDAGRGTDIPTVPMPNSAVVHSLSR